MGEIKFLNALKRETHFTYPVFYSAMAFGCDVRRGRITPLYNVFLRKTACRIHISGTYQS